MMYACLERKIVVAQVSEAVSVVLFAVVKHELEVKKKTHILVCETNGVHAKQGTSRKEGEGWCRYNRDTLA
jgi:hypothetical protein